MMRVALLAVAGFAIGAVAGFVYAQETKKGIGDAVSTRWSDGKLIVELDTIEAASTGFDGLLTRFGLGG